MYYASVNPAIVLPWEHSNTTPQLIHIARSGLLKEKTGFISVFEIPLEYRCLGNYVIHDGHKRFNAATLAGVELPIQVIQKPIDFLEVPGYNFPENYKLSVRQFNNLLMDYLQNAIDFLSTF